MEIEKEIELVESDDKVFGFWIYLMTDVIIFACLFASFVVLRNNIYGGPSAHQIFDFPTILTETLLLLTSTFTCAIGMLQTYQKNKIPALIWFGITFVLGCGFLYLEIKDFKELVDKGEGWQVSAFLSSYFTLVGMHGLHITVGLLWMAVMMFRIYLRPLIKHSISKVLRMSLFWHFLDFIWIFIFTIVYGMGFLTG